MSMSKERTIYLKLLQDIENTHRALDLVDKRVHDLLEEIDTKAAKRLVEAHEKWMDSDDPQN